MRGIPNTVPAYDDTHTWYVHREGKQQRLRLYHYHTVALRVSCDEVGLFFRFFARIVCRFRPLHRGVPRSRSCPVAAARAGDRTLSDLCTPSFQMEDLRLSPRFVDRSQTVPSLGRTEMLKRGPVGCPPAFVTNNNAIRSIGNPLYGADLRICYPRSACPTTSQSHDCCILTMVNVA